MRARVFVTLKPSVFDPQGKTVTDALHTLGYSAVKDVRQGKYFELEIDTECPDDARALALRAEEGGRVEVVLERERRDLARVPVRRARARIPGTSLLPELPQVGLQRTFAARLESSG